MKIIFTKNIDSPFLFVLVIYFFEMSQSEAPHYDPYQTAFDKLEESYDKEDWKTRLAKAVYSSLAYQTPFDDHQNEGGVPDRHHMPYHEYKHNPKPHEVPYRRYRDHGAVSTRIDIPSTGKYAIPESDISEGSGGQEEYYTEDNDDDYDTTEATSAEVGLNKKLLKKVFPW